MVEEEKSHIDDSLEVLVWPKVIEPRARRKKLEAKGWVLGWKLPKKQNEDNHDSNNAADAPLSVWLCAGILNTSQSLVEYENRIKLLQDNAAVLSTGDGPSLVTSLQILATWKRGQINRPTSKGARRSKGSKASTADSKVDTSIEGEKGFPIITNEKNYPWIKIDKDENDDESVDSNATPPTNNATITDKKRKPKATSKSLSSQQQLLYYSVYPDNPLTHLKTEFQDSGASDFSALLDRINHSQEILQLVQNGNIPKETKMKRSGNDDKMSRRRSNKRAEEGTSTQGDTESTDETNGDSKDGNILRQLSGFIFSQSLVLQHFHQLASPSNSILVTMPTVQCWQARREISNFFYKPISVNNFKYFPTSLFPWKSNLVKTHIADSNRWGSSLLDMLLGVLACFVMWTIFKLSPSPAGLYHISKKRALFHFLNKGVDWLETFPAGFKLNVKITTNLGYEIRNLLGWYQEVLEATVWNGEFNQDWLFPVLSGIALCFGWTGLLAVVIDLTRLEVLHTLVLAKIFRILYQAELYLLSSLWRLFRGKKRNRLRQRTDSMQYDSTQLLVGTIGFCICIFLWTTILVYYTFFMLWNFALQLPILGLWVLYTVVRSLPMASIWLRVTKGSWFAENVYTQVLLEEGDSFTIARLVGLNRSHGNILQESLQPHLKGLSNWVLGSILELIKPRSSNQVPCAFPLSTLFQVYE